MPGCCSAASSAPLHAEHAAAGTLLDESECPPADAHGQHRFNFRHPHIGAGLETELLRRAFRRDFEVNGPSVLRVARTLLRGWRRHRDHPEPRVRRRYRRECAGLSMVWAGAAWAAERWLGRGSAAAGRVRDLRRDLEAEFGLRARVAGPLVGAAVLLAMRRERARLRQGHRFEPPTFYEANEAAMADGARGARACRAVAPPLPGERVSVA